MAFATQLSLTARLILFVLKRGPHTIYALAHEVERTVRQVRNHLRSLLSAGSVTHQAEKFGRAWRRVWRLA